MNIDQVVNKAKQAVDVAMQKTEHMFGVSKLKFEIAKVQSEMKNTYEKIGQSIFEMRKNGYHNEELLLSLCEEIEQLQAREQSIRQEISALRDEVICQVCYTSNQKENIYCVKCGTQLVKMPSQNPPFWQSNSAAQPPSEDSFAPNETTPPSSDVSVF